MTAYTVICENKVHQHRAGQKRRQYEVHGRRERKSCLHLPAELCSMVGAKYPLMDLTTFVENQVQDSKLDCPLKRAREPLAISNESNRSRKVEHIFVEQCYYIVLAAHQPIGYIVCVEALLGLVGHMWHKMLRQEATLRRGDVCRSLDVLITKASDLNDHVLPRDCLHIFLRDFQQENVEIPNVYQPWNIQRPLDRLPDHVEATDPQAEVPYSPHMLGALRYHDL